MTPSVLSAALFHSGLVSALALALMTAQLSWLLKGRVDWIATIALFLHFFLMYLGDRLATNPEDENSRETTSGHFVRKHWLPFTGAAVVSLFVLVGLCGARPWLLLAAPLGSLVCAGYFLKVPFVGKRIKELPFVKGFYVPLAMQSVMFLYLRALPRMRWEHLAFCLGLFLVMHVDTVLYDLKDLENDRRAGIQTLAGVMGRGAFLLLQLVLLGVAVSLGLTLPLPLAVSTVMAALCIAAACLWLLRAEFGPFMCLYVDGVVALSYAFGLIALIAALGLAAACPWLLRAELGSILFVYIECVVVALASALALITAL